MEGHRLQFQNINLYIGNKQILHDVSGMAEPGKLLVIMGPSGKYMKLSKFLLYLGLFISNVSYKKTLNTKFQGG
jgi:ABC-type arginine transport system ATPase subunit